MYSPQYHVSEVPKEVKVLVTYGEEDSPPFKSQGDDYHKVRGSREFLYAPPCIHLIFVSPSVQMILILEVLDIRYVLKLGILNFMYARGGMHTCPLHPNVGTNSYCKGATL